MRSRGEYVDRGFDFAGITVHRMGKLFGWRYLVAVVWVVLKVVSVILWRVVGGIVAVP